MRIENFIFPNLEFKKITIKVSGIVFLRSLKVLVKRIKCVICDKMFLGQEYVRRHCKVVHKE